MHGCPGLWAGAGLRGVSALSPCVNGYYRAGTAANPRALIHTATRSGCSFAVQKCAPAQVRLSLHSRAISAKPGYSRWAGNLLSANCECCPMLLASGPSGGAPVKP